MTDAITGASKEDKEVIFLDGILTIVSRDISDFKNYEDTRIMLSHNEGSDLFTVIDLKDCKQVFADVEHDNVSLTLYDIDKLWPDVYMVIFETVLTGDIYKRDKSFEGFDYWKRVGTTVGFGG